MGDTLGHDGECTMNIDDEEVPDLDWAVIKSLMDAQANTSTSLERYLLYVTHDDFDLDEAHVDRCLSQAIDHHVRALEDLQVARELISENAE